MLIAGTRILNKYAYGSYLRDVKRERNPSRKYGRFGLHVSLKLFFWRIFLGKVSLWFSFN